MLILPLWHLISDFFQNMNFYHLLPELSRERSLPLWTLRLIFNAGKHGEMRPWWSVFLACPRALFSFSVCRGRRRQQKPSPRVPGPSSLSPVRGTAISSFCFHGWHTASLVGKEYFWEKDISLYCPDLQISPRAVLLCTYPFFGARAPIAHFGHLRNAFLRSRSALPGAFTCWLRHLLHSYVVPWWHCLWSV